MFKPKLARIAGLLLLFIATTALGASSNPLLDKTQLPDFKSINAADFAPAIDAVLQQYNDTIAKVVTMPASWDNTIQPLEEATIKFTRIWNIISHLNAVYQTDAIKAAYDMLLPKVTGFYATIMNNPDIYKAYTTILASPEFSKLTTAQQAVITQMLLHYKLSGVNLDDKGKFRYTQITIRLNELAALFTSNLQKATAAWQYSIPADSLTMLAGLPQNIIDTAAQKALALGKTGWVLTLDPTCLVAVESYAQNRALRQTLYTGYVTIASDQDPASKQNKWDNGPLITEIISLRQELAELTGFKNYAEYSIADNGDPTTDKVLQFLNDLAAKTKPTAVQEVAVLQDFAAVKDKIDKLECWDLAYYAEWYKREHYAITADEIRKYFPEKKVLTGLLDLVSLVFDLQIKEVTDASTWDPAVKVYVINDQNNKPRGYFYADLYKRDLKRDGSWTSDLIPRLHWSNSDMQLPVAFINANFAANVDQMLTYDDLLVLFHEFGNMLQHTLILSDYPSISGINAELEDAEDMVASFMEAWGSKFEVVEDVSQHVESGDALPQDSFENLLAAKNFDAAIQLIRQLEFALFDFRLHLHAPADANKAPLQLLNEIRQDIAVIPNPDNDRFPSQFKHIFMADYAAKYFEYKWAEMLAADALKVFQDNGLINPVIGGKFLHAFIEQGGTNSTLYLFKQFAGRDPNVAPLLKLYGIGQQ